MVDSVEVERLVMVVASVRLLVEVEIDVSVAAAETVALVVSVDVLVGPLVVVVT